MTNDIKNQDRKYRPLVYVASAYSGDVTTNTEKAKQYCRFAMEQGQIPLVPNLMFPQFMNDEDPAERELAIFMDKTADIQKDKKGNVLYDTETKDTEIVPWKINIDDYMASEVLPHVPDAKAFFEEDLGKKNPVIKTGAEIPFTRYFYKYQAPVSSDELAKRFNELEASVDSRIKKLFGGNQYGRNERQWYSCYRKNS